MQVFFVAPGGVGRGRGGSCLSVFVNIFCFITTDPYILFFFHGHYPLVLFESLRVP